MSYYDLYRELQRQQGLPDPEPMPPSPPQPQWEPGVEGAANLLGNAPVLGGALQGIGRGLATLSEAPVLGGLLNAVSYPGQVMRGVLLSDQFAGKTGDWGAAPTFDSAGQGIGRFVERATHGENPFQGAVDDWEQVPMSLKKLLVDAVVDPTNLVGFGAAGSAARAAGGNATRLGRVLGKVDAAEQAAQSTISRGLNTVGDKAGDVARAGLHKVPFKSVATLLDDSPRKAVAIENDTALHHLNATAAFFGEDNAGRVLSDLGLDPADPRYQAAYTKIKNRIDDMLTQAGAGTGNIKPDDYIATYQAMLHDFDPEFIQRFTDRSPRYFEQLDKDRILLDQTIQGMYGTGVKPKSVNEAIRYAQAKGLDTDEYVLKSLQKRWRGADLLVDPEDHLILSRYLRRYAHEQGIGDPFKLGDIPKTDHLPEWLQTFEPGEAYRNALTAWKQQALFWPSYWINNYGDIRTKSALHGVPQGGTADLGHNLAGVMGKFAEDVDQSALGDFLSNTPGLRDQYDKLKNSRRYQQSQAAMNTMGPEWERFAEEVGMNRPPPEILQGGISQEIGGIKSAGSGLPAKGFERVPGLGEIFQTARQLSEALETSARSSAFMHGYRRFMKDNLEHTSGRIQRILEEGGIAPSARDQVAAHLQANEGVISPTRLAQILASEGVDDANIAAAMRELGNVQSDAYRAGQKLNEKIHFDYRNTTNLDELLRNVTGFHFWATRNIPAYTELMATHPGVWASLNRLEDESNQWREEMLAKSPRLQGTIPIGGLGREVHHMLFGSEGDTFWDPRKLISVTDNPLSPDVAQPARGETGVGRALDVASAMGVSPNPLIQIPLEVAGVYGARQPGNVLRATPTANALVEKVTGNQFDLEGPLKDLRRQRPLGGEAPTPPEMMVKWALREMGQERWGNPNAPAVRAAMQDPDHPLYKEAVRRMGDRAFMERLSSTVGIPLKFQSDAQQAVDRRYV